MLKWKHKHFIHRTGGLGFVRRHIPYIMIVTLITLVISGAMASAGTLSREKELHFEAWRDTAEKAAHIPRYKYALYASRSLAVKHPELYLQGDAIFNKLLASLPNMALFLHRTA